MTRHYSHHLDPNLWAKNVHWGVRYIAANEMYLRYSCKWNVFEIQLQMQCIGKCISLLTRTCLCCNITSPCHSPEATRCAAGALPCTREDRQSRDDWTSCRDGRGHTECRKDVVTLKGCGHGCITLMTGERRLFVSGSMIPCAHRRFWWSHDYMEI